MYEWLTWAKSRLRQTTSRLPLSYRVLCGHFLLRIVDLESLSMEADVPRFLGQFAGVLIMLSLIHAAFAYVAIGESAWMVEQYLIRTTILVSGLIVVISWESTFPDRIDSMNLGALPLPAGVIPAAKVSAVCALLGMALLALNAVPGLEVPLLLGAMHGHSFGVVRAFGAYWVTMVSATLFMYGGALTLQGTLALLLPRRFFLRTSAALQVVGFALLLGVYFLEPSLTTPAAIMAPASRTMLAWSPQFWFFGIFSQINGDLPGSLRVLAWRGWVTVAGAVAGAVVTLWSGYPRIMRRTLEETDLLPSRASGAAWRVPLSGHLRRAIVLFSAKALARSRHHRVASAFYVAVALSIGLSSVAEARSTSAPHGVTRGFLMGSVAMMGLAVPGLRSLFSLPISLHANWLWRLTESDTPGRYVAGTRTVLWLMAVAPIWTFAAVISCFYRPWWPAAEHLVVLLFLGAIFSEFSLLWFRKVPFACSYMPGKSNMQAVFWTAVLVLLPLSAMFAVWERKLLWTPAKIGWLLAGLCAAEVALWLCNQAQGWKLQLDFEDAEPDLVVTLGLGSG